MTRLLLCRSGQRICGIPLKFVLETMRALPVTALAHLPDIVLGLASIRGRPTPVLDVSRIVGGWSATAARRFVTIDLGQQRSVALAVQDVLDVRVLEERALETVPSLLQSERAEAIAAFGTLDHELLIVLRSTRLLPERIWQQLERAGAS